MNTENNSTKLPWLVCFTAALFFFYEFIQMNMFNAIDLPLMQTFSLTALQLGKLSATYFYANIFFLLFAGAILDSVSTRKIILIALFICFSGTFAFAISSSLAMAAICRLLTGIGSAFCFLSSVRIASRWFPPQKLAFIIGLIVMMAMTGGVVAQTPLTLLVNLVGWRQALIIDSGVGLLIFIAIWGVVKDYPSSYTEIYQEQRKHLSALGAWQTWKMAFTKWQNWRCGIYTCALNMPIGILGGIWGIPFLTATRHLSVTQASYITTFLFLGAIIGSPVMGWLSDRIGKRRLPMLGGVVLSITLLALILCLPSLNLYALMVLFLLLGFTTSTQVISYPTVAESNYSTITATSVSIVSLSVISGYGIFQPLFGWLIDLKWSGAMQNGAPYYTPSDFSWAIMMIPIGFMAGFIAASLLKETFCKKTKILESERIEAIQNVDNMATSIAE